MQLLKPLVYGVLPCISGAVAFSPWCKSSLMHVVNRTMSGSTESDWKTATSIYDFNAKDIKGNNVSLHKYAGLPCIVVNVASA